MKCLKSSKNYIELIIATNLTSKVSSLRIHFCKLLIIICCILTSTASALAQGETISDFHNKNIDIKLYFRWDKSYIDKDYMGNAQTLALLDSILNDKQFIATVDTISVTALSSIEGAYSYNQRLSERRKATLEKYITTNYPDIDRGKLYFSCMSENWVEFRELIANDADIPSKDAVLRIIDSDQHYDTKERLLTRLDGGKPWRHITRNILPYQRYGASFIFIPKMAPVTVLSNYIKPITTSYEVEEIELTFPEIEYPAAPKTLFALKTNLVWDAVSVINIGVEVLIGNRLSVVAEVVHPWWRSWSCNYTMQIESYHGEIKYWLGNRNNREKLTGWSVGAYGGWGRYDVQPFTETGVQGEFSDFGIELGYAHPIARNLHLEYTIGAGYVCTTYNDYKMAYETDEYGDIKVIPYPWMTNKLSAVLPTRFGVSLVWVINTKGKGGNK